jgi:predicted nucleic acid-binding Zn ribbon protein
MIFKTQLENVEYFHYLCSMTTNCASCRCETKSRTVMPKAAFDKTQTIFTRKLDLHVRKKLVKCYVWKVAFIRSEHVDQKFIESFELRCWRRTEKPTWADRVRKEVLQSVREDRNILYKWKEGRLNRLAITWAGTAFYNTLRKESRGKDKSDGKMRKKT